MGDVDMRPEGAHETAECERGRRAPIYFIHIPKTGGTSIAALLREQYRSDQVVFAYEDELHLASPNPAFVSQARARMPHVEIVYGHYFYGAHEILGTPARYVTILRDPFERVLSFYNHHARVPSWPYYAMIRAGMGVADFVRGFVDYQVNNLMVRMIAGVKDRDGVRVFSSNYLERALEIIERSFAFVGTTHHLAAGMATLARRLGWRDGRTPRLNCEDGPLVPALDADARAAIEEYNQLDLRLYRAFENGDYENPAI